MKKFKQLSPFTQKLFIGIGVMLAIVFCALIFLWIWLADYQRALPTNFCDEIQQAYETADGAALQSLCTNLPAVLQNADKFSAYLQQNINTEDLYYYPGTAAAHDEAVYEFVSGGHHLAQLTLRKTGKKSLFGFTLYEVKALEQLPAATYTLTAPSGVTVLVNGEELSEQYLTGQEDAADCYDGIVAATPKNNTYEISDFNYVETVEASVNGVPCSVNWNTETNEIIITRVPSDTVQQQLASTAEYAAKEYIVFATQRYAPNYNVVALLYPNTTLYNAVLSYGNEWGEVYVADRYEDIVLDSFTAYSDTEFACRVSMTYVITEDTGNEKTFPFNAMLYFTVVNGNWRWVAMQAL